MLTHSLPAQVADEAGVEMKHELEKGETNKVPDLTEPAKRIDEEDALAQRLRALRPAT